MIRRLKKNKKLPDRDDDLCSRKTSENDESQVVKVFFRKELIHNIVCVCVGGGEQKRPPVVWGKEIRSSQKLVVVQGQFGAV